MSMTEVSMTTVYST